MIPPHVAAYAAGLCHAGASASWPAIATLIATLGMGTYDAGELARAADAWAAATMDPELLEEVRKQFHRPAPRRPRRGPPS